MKEKHDKATIFGRITFGAIALLVLGGIFGIAFDSAGTFGVFAALGILAFSSNLLLLDDDSYF